VLSDIDSASLKSTMSHLSIESKETKSWVSSETTIIILHQMFEVVADGDLDLTLSQEVTCTSGEEGGEGTCEVSLGGKFIEGVIPYSAVTLTATAAVTSVGVTQ